MSREQREELQAVLLAGNALKFQANAIRRYGVAGGVLVRELLYWDGKGHDSDGYIYLTKAECQERTGLSPKSQDGARQRLERAGVLEVERLHRRLKDGSRRKHPSLVLHYRLDLEQLVEDMETDPETLKQRFKDADADTRTRGLGSSNAPKVALEHAVTGPPSTQGSAEATARGNAKAHLADGENHAGAGFSPHLTSKKSLNDEITASRALAS